MSEKETLSQLVERLRGLQKSSCYIQHLANAAPRLIEAAELVEELGNWIFLPDHGYSRCPFCGLSRYVEDINHPLNHKATCLWRKAREI